MRTCENRQPIAIKKTGCNEECLRRIAARLCRLDDHEARVVSEQASSSFVEPTANANDVQPPAVGFYSATQEAARCCDESRENTTDEKCAFKVGCSNSCCDPKEEYRNLSKADVTNSVRFQDVSGCCPNSVSAVNSSSVTTSCCANNMTPLNTAGKTCHTLQAKSMQQESASACIDECCELVEPLKADTPRPSTACSAHLRATFDRFEALIRQSKCICRSVVRQMGVSCCSLSADGSIAVKQPSPTASMIPNISRNVPGGKSFAGNSSDTCCKEKHHEAVQNLETREASGGQAKSDGCCAGENRCGNNDGKRTAGTSTGETATEMSRDIEHSSAREHITLNISGMTCTGCSTKMVNALRSIPGLHKPDVTFISESATFELDPSITSAEEVLPVIERRTGFKCSRVFEGYQHLDVYMSSELAEQLQSSSPAGLVSISKAKKTYRLTYNPHSIGARDLLPHDAKLAPPTTDATIGEGRQRLLLMSWYTGVAATFTIPVIVLNWAPNPLSRQTRDIVSLVLATFVQAIAIPEFYIGALKALVFSRVIEMDMLVVISVTSAYAYSVVAFGMREAGFVLEQHAFFETSTLLITLVLLGRLVAAIARARAIRAVSVRSLQVDEAHLLLSDNSITTIDARLLQFGDSILVRPHSRIVTDATVLSGTSSVDESMLTGETVPIVKAQGDMIIAGTLNGEGVLHARILRLPGANSIDAIAKSVEKALSAKVRVQDLADKVASWFVPAVVAISVVVFAIWIAVALKVRGATPGGAVGTAITYAIAVLAVSCPCALGLAVPMVLVIAGGVAARAGVVIKAADATERSYQATDVVFDKTGTLTAGDLSVVKQASLSSGVATTEVLSLVASVVKDETHPVARAVATYLGTHQLQSVELSTTSSVPGSGIQAEWNNKSVKIGNAFWLGIDSEPTVAAILSDGMTCLCLTLDATPVLAFGLRDRIREEAAAVVLALSKRNITCHIVSGDHAKAVEYVASSLGLDHENIASRHSPVQKQQYVQALQDAGKTVIFCGDGTNDAVALAQANVGAQMGTASDVSGAVADVVLLGGLNGLLTLLDLSKRAFARIAFNFFWSAVYNVFAILLAAGAFVRFRIPPAYAGLGEIVSVGPVILAAVTLLIGRGGRRAA